MKHTCHLLLISVCYLLIASSCFGGSSKQRLMLLGSTEKVTDDISYTVTNNSSENRFEVVFTVENSAEAWFSVSIGSHAPDIPGWNSRKDAEPPVKITDSSGNAIVFPNDGYYRFNKSTTFYISYNESPEKLKEFFSGFYYNQPGQMVFSLDINNLQVVSDYTYDPKSDKEN